MLSQLRGSQLKVLYIQSQLKSMIDSAEMI